MVIAASWDFGATGLKLGDTAAPDPRLEPASLFPDADVPDLDEFTLDTGVLRVGFRQLLQIGPGEDRILTFDEGGTRLTLGVTEDGVIRLTHTTADDVVVFETAEDFFVPGDSILITHTWDFGGDGGLSRFENLTTEATYEQAVPGTLTLDEAALDADAWRLGDPGDEAEVWSFNGRLTHMSLHDDTGEDEGAQVEEIGMVLAAPPVWEDDDDDDDECPPDDWAGHPGLVPGGADTVTGSDGADFLVTGAGTVRLEGGGGNDTLIAGAGSVEDHTVTFTYEGGTAGFLNSFGVYVIDPVSGAIGDVHVAWPEVRADVADGQLVPGVSVFSLTVPPGAQLGAFLISDGGRLNDFDTHGAGRFAFVRDDGSPAGLDDPAPSLVHVGADGMVTALSGNVWHSAGHGPQVGLNADGAVHLRGISENDDGSWTFGWEDMHADDWDGDFNDVVFTVDPGRSGARFLNPDHDAVAPMPPADPESHHILIGDDGDDLIHTGAGRDMVDAGDGDDTIFAGPGDTVDGGAGTDTLVLSDAFRIREINRTSEVANADGSVTQSGVIRFEDCAQDLHFSNIEKIVPCFTPGTLIDTSGGPVPVEHLRPGDRVLTRDHGFQTLQWVGRRSVDGAELAARPEVRAILIGRDAFGPGLPERDMRVSPQHRILMCGPEAEMLFGEHEVLVPALHLVGLPGVSRDTAPEVSYVHIMCARHEIVRGDGVWSESFQPGDMSLAGLDSAQRGELLYLFPELADLPGRRAYRAARLTLKAHEARALFAPVIPRRVAAAHDSRFEGLPDTLAAERWDRIG